MHLVYYVELQATNGAGLIRTILSKPIVLDTADPFGGLVKDGDNFDNDVSFQSQNTEMRGTFNKGCCTVMSNCERVSMDTLAPRVSWCHYENQGNASSKRGYMHIN